MPKAVIYARVSSKEQEKEGFSIPVKKIGGKIDNEYRKPFDIFAKGLNSVKNWILQS